MNLIYAVLFIVCLLIFMAVIKFVAAFAEIKREEQRWDRTQKRLNYRED